MGAFSLYRGNMHRVPDVSRRWPMPSHQITLRDFKNLLRRRSRTLRLSRDSPTAAIPIATPNEGATGGNKQFDADPDANPEPLTPQRANGACGGVEDQGVADDVDCSSDNPLGNDSVPVPGLKPVAVDSAVDPTVLQSDSKSLPEDNPGLSGNPNPETKPAGNMVSGITDVEKRKREVEEKLHVLKQKKHTLVQVLKQILNAEEELKTGSMQSPALAGRPPFQIQVDTGNDSGSMNKHVANRMSSEGNLGGDMEGGEADDHSNPNMSSRKLLRMSGSMSPPSGSPPRRPVVTGSPSPSRFAPMGHQGHPASAPTISVSGSSCIASSPSPAALGGTSVFRGARFPSLQN